MIDEFSNYMSEDELIIRVPRLNTDFKIKSITTKKVYAILKECKRSKEIEEIQLHTKFIVACMVEPDLLNATLQDKYNVKNPEDLVLIMFKPGEFSKISIACMKICGYDLNPEEEITRIKN